VPIAQGVVAIGSVMTLHLMVSYASYRSRWFDRLLDAGSDLLLSNGLSSPRRLRRACRAPTRHPHRPRPERP